MYTELTSWSGCSISLSIKNADIQNTCLWLCHLKGCQDYSLSHLLCQVIYVTSSNKSSNLRNLVNRWSESLKGLILVLLDFLHCIALPAVINLARLSEGKGLLFFITSEVLRLHISFECSGKDNKCAETLLCEKCLLHARKCYIYKR